MSSDHWSPAKALTLDIGLRTQWSRITGTTPPAPRLAAAWAPKALGGVKLSAGWGVYYDTATLALLALSEEQTSLTTWFAPDGSPVRMPVQSAYLVNMRQLRTPRFTVASASAEKNLPWNFFGRVGFTARDGERGFAFDQIAASPVLNEYVANNSRTSRYRAAEVRCAALSAGNTSGSAVIRDRARPRIRRFSIRLKIRS